MQSFYIRLITRNGLTALRTGSVIPGMWCAAILATPPLVLHFQPVGETFVLDYFHVLQYTLPVRILCIRNELLHEFTGLQFGALIAEFMAFALSASLDAAGRAKPGRLFTFASVTLLVIVYFSGLGRQHNWASAAIHATISMQYKVHKLFHLDPIH
jgi:hypothetical protein